MAGVMGGRKRRLVLFFLTVVSLLSFYILCVNLEIHMPWRMADRLARIHHGNGHGSSPEPSRSQDSLVFNRDHWIHTPPPAATLDPTLVSGSTVVNEHTSAAHLKTATKPRVATTTTKTTTTTEAITPAKKSSDPPPLLGDRTLESKPVPDAKDNAKPTTKESNLQPQLPSTRAAKSTEPPYLGDTYATEEDIPLQTDCPDSITRRVTSTDLADRFLRHVPVLQWAKSTTPDQYERLSQYPGAHGWGVVDYKTLVSTLSVLNSSANWQMFDDWNQQSNRSKCVRCAVVGNGGILKDSKRGREIDQHDYVFRTNGAVIKGFEQDVGSRTTHYTFSTNTLKNSMRSYAGLGYRGPPVSEETRYVFLPDHDRDYLLMKAAATHTPVERGPEHSDSPPNYFGENVSASKFKMYHPDFIRYLRNRFLRSHTLKTRYKDIYRPSTGAVMLLAAVHTCDQVSAYGFMTPDFRNYSDHYYDSSYHAVGFFINHDLRMEMSLWQQLHQARLIRLYMRQ